MEARPAPGKTIFRDRGLYQLRAGRLITPFYALNTVLNEPRERCRPRPCPAGRGHATLQVPTVGCAGKDPGGGRNAPVTTANARLARMTSASPGLLAISPRQKALYPETFDLKFTHRSGGELQEWKPGRNTTVQPLPVNRTENGYCRIETDRRACLTHGSRAGKGRDKSVTGPSS